MKFKKVRFKNGVRVIVVPMPSLDSVTVTVWVGVGSKHEEKGLGGISHFMEHMVFKGGEKRNTAKKVSEAIDSVGGKINASTSKQRTNFFVKVINDHLETGFDVLSDIVLSPKLSSKDIEKEKGVIVEEIGMYEDMPGSHVWDMFERMIFKGNGYGPDIIGTRDSVRRVKRADFRRFMDLYYKPSNMVITVSGGVSYSKAMDLARKYFGGMKSSGDLEVDLGEFEFMNRKRLAFNKNMKLKQANLVLGFPGTGVDNKDRYVKGVLSTILSGGMSSRLFTEVREKRGLAYSVSAGTTNFLETGYFSASAGVDPEKSTEAIKVILDELYKMTNKSTHRIDRKEFKKAKSFMKGRLALSLEGTGSVNRFLGMEELLLGKVRTPDEVYKKIDEVGVADVARVAKEFFVPKKLNLAVIGPFKEKSRFEKLVN